MLSLWNERLMQEEQTETNQSDADAMAEARGGHQPKKMSAIRKQRTFYRPRESVFDRSGRMRSMAELRQ